jgi:hypothetical protein
VQRASASLLSTLSSTKINEVRFGYSRYRTPFSGLDGSSDPASFGTSASPFNLGSGKLGLPEIDFGGVFENFGASGFSIPRGRVSQSYQILGQLHAAQRAAHHQVRWRVSASNDQQL